MGAEAVAAKKGPFKLTYFDFIGRGEYIRMALVLSGLPWEDVRLTAEQQAAMKAGEGA